MEDLLQSSNIQLEVCKQLKPDLCGIIIQASKEEVVTKFQATKQMISDENDIIHSGFIFNAASYAAMCLVNQTYSLIIKSEVQFLAPLEFGQEMTFIATMRHSNNKQCEVVVKGSLLDIKIFEASFYISIFDKQIFKLDFQES